MRADMVPGAVSRVRECLSVREHESVLPFARLPDPIFLSRGLTPLVIERGTDSPSTFCSMVPTGRNLPFGNENLPLVLPWVSTGIPNATMFRTVGGGPWVV